MRSAVVAAIVIGALSVAAQVSVHVQTDPAAQPSPTEQTVTVEGCLRGKRFIPDTTMLNTRMVFESLGVKELILEGQPALMKTLEKQHDGHQEEITGIVTLPDNIDKRSQGRQGQVGKRTRVTTTTIAPGSSPDPRPGGVPRVSTNTLPQQQWLRMKVTSLRHINNNCQFVTPLFSR
jgi:hypothetical protein